VPPRGRHGEGRLSGADGRLLKRSPLVLASQWGYTVTPVMQREREVLTEKVRFAADVDVQSSCRTLRNTEGRLCYRFILRRLMRPSHLTNTALAQYSTWLLPVYVTSIHAVAVTPQLEYIRQTSQSGSFSVAADVDAMQPSKKTVHPIVTSNPIVLHLLCLGLPSPRHIASSDNVRRPRIEGGASGTLGLAPAEKSQRSHHPVRLHHPLRLHHPWSSILPARLLPRYYSSTWTGKMRSKLTPACLSDIYTSSDRAWCRR
jgi:hypothetical protein